MHFEPVDQEPVDQEVEVIDLDEEPVVEEEPVDAPEYHIYMAGDLYGNAGSGADGAYYVLKSGPSNGSFNFYGSGEFDFHATPGFSGPVTFEHAEIDAYGNETTHVVAIKVDGISSGYGDDPEYRGDDADDNDDAPVYEEEDQEEGDDEVEVVEIDDEHDLDDEQEQDEEQDNNDDCGDDHDSENDSDCCDDDCVIDPCDKVEYDTHTNCEPVCSTHDYDCTPSYHYDYCYSYSSSNCSSWGWSWSWKSLWSGWCW
jgi:hypothetical protein